MTHRTANNRARWAYERRRGPAVGGMRPQNPIRAAVGIRWIICAAKTFAALTWKISKPLRILSILHGRKVGSMVVHGGASALAVADLLV
jgi:hypothetical protein